MAEYLISDTTLTRIADSIRSKTGKTATITPENMPKEIDGIEAGSGGGEGIDTCTVRISYTGMHESFPIILTFIDSNGRITSDQVDIRKSYDSYTEFECICKSLICFASSMNDMVHTPDTMPELYYSGSDTGEDMMLYRIDANPNEVVHIDITNDMSGGNSAD